MILDKETRLSNSQAVTSSALSTNVIDLGGDFPIGSGEPMAVVFSVEVAADQTSGDEDYTFTVWTGSTEAIDATIQELGRLIFESGTPSAPALDADLLVAGFQFAIVIPPFGPSVGSRYLGAYYITAGNSPTITVSADLVPLKHVPASVMYPKGYTIN